MNAGVRSSLRHASVASGIASTKSSDGALKSTGSLIAEALRSIPMAISRAFEMAYVAPYQAARRPDRFAETPRRGTSREF